MKIRHLLLAAISIHFTASACVYLAGAFAVFPDYFDPHGFMMADSSAYRTELVSLVSAFNDTGMLGWLSAPVPIHIKIYSLSFIPCSPLMGSNILAVELINLLYYLITLSLIFNIGKNVSDRRAGLLAAVIVALWPSFLLHSTQVLRDPLFIVAVLTLALVGSKWLTAACTGRVGIVTGFIGGSAVSVIWLIRSDMWELIIAVMALAFLLLLARQLKERKILTGNTVGAVILVTFILLVPRSVPSSSYLSALYSRRSAGGEKNRVFAEGRSPDLDGRLRASSSDGRLRASSSERLLHVPARISLLRQRFIKMYSGAGSNIHTDIILKTNGDLLRYIPRAAAIGFLAPSPDMWVTVGNHVGRAGRLLVGGETLVLYLFNLLALAGLCYRREQLSVWWLWLSAAIGFTALGLVVVNIGALFRMRYVFCMLLVIVGSEGLLRTLSSIRSRGRRLT
ncbi:MAG: glycosyltransferase family 39 protein [Pyrinomonadaceae bacterium]